MKWQQFISDVYERIAQVLEEALTGLSQEDLNQQPNTESNPIGWLAWHLTRAQDKAMQEISGGEQLWIKDKWYARFNRPADPEESGVRHTLEQVAAFKSPDAATLLAYNRAVAEQMKNVVGNLSEGELGRKLPNPRRPSVATVGARLVANINDNLQHAGQIAYVRGFLKGKGWFEM